MNFSGELLCVRQAGSIALTQAPKGELRVAILLLFKCGNGHCQKGFYIATCFSVKVAVLFSFNKCF